MGADDRILVEIDGPDVSPRTIDAPLFLEIAASFLHLLQINAVELDTPLALSQIEIIDKCAAVRVVADHPGIARECASLALGQVNGEVAPRGAAAHLDRLRTAIRRLPPGLAAGVIVGGWKRAIEVATMSDVRPFDEIVSLRAEPVRVGGKRPAVRFRSPLETEYFTLGATEDQARALGAMLYTQVEIVARVARDAEGLIDSGTLQTFEAVAGGDARVAWQEWFAAVDREGPRRDK